MKFDDIGIGGKIKELRKSKDLTQAELAIAIGVKTSTVSSYELNERQPSYDVLKNIAWYFKVTTDYLLGCEKRYLFKELKVEQEIFIMRMVRFFKDYNQLYYYDTDEGDL
ncbi:MAG: helix-turn-helix domain-containing protein [Oscillospiraceae bacterium]|nr:helix-turn-helix domain-containing protein [Oscillospiraceae bacterium]